MSLRHHLITTALCASCLMTSGGYLARSFNADPARPTIVSHDGHATHNWYQAKQSRKVSKITTADKSALTMRISALTNERMR